MDGIRILQRFDSAPTLERLFRILTQEVAMSDRIRLAWYGATVFLASALLLLLEIVAGRLIAPYVGASLYTWTSVIGVILAGLSLGNWLGGHWADRGANERAVGVTLTLAGLASLAVLVLLALVAPVIQGNGFDLLSASFLYVMSLFFIPSMLLGIVTPLLTTMALWIDMRAGHIVGRMHALAALGSILGTFAAGYWLIQFFGTRTVITGSAIALFLLALPFLLPVARTAMVFMLLAACGIAALASMFRGFENPCDKESQYYCIRVVDAQDQVPTGQARAMILDHLLHSINHAQYPHMLVSPYVQLMDELVLDHFDHRANKLRWFFSGGGAYTQPRALTILAPESDVTVAEIDPQVTRLAQAKMFVTLDHMRVLHMDARVALARLQGERFNVIVGDVFHDIVVPYHFITREYAHLVKDRLSSDGLYVLNIVDTLEDPLLVKSLIKTLKKEFQFVHACLPMKKSAELREAYVITASNKYQPPAYIESQRGFDRHWQRVTQKVLANGTLISEVPLLTDDFAPVERLVSRLILTDSGI